MHEVSGYSFISAVSIYCSQHGKGKTAENKVAFSPQGREGFCLWNNAEGSSVLSDASQEGIMGV